MSGHQLALPGESGGEWRGPVRLASPMICAYLDREPNDETLHTLQEAFEGSRRDYVELTFRGPGNTLKTHMNRTRIYLGKTGAPVDMYAQVRLDPVDLYRMVGCPDLGFDAIVDGTGGLGFDATVRMDELRAYSEDGQLLGARVNSLIELYGEHCDPGFGAALGGVRAGQGLRLELRMKPGDPIVLDIWVNPRAHAIWLLSAACGGLRGRQERACDELAALAADLNRIRQAELVCERHPLWAEARELLRQT